jgi:hypothetical protein
MFIRFLGNFGSQKSVFSLKFFNVLKEKNANKKFYMQQNCVSEVRKK